MSMSKSSCCQLASVQECQSPKRGVVTVPKMERKKIYLASKSHLKLNNIVLFSTFRREIKKFVIVTEHDICNKESIGIIVEIIII